MERRCIDNFARLAVNQFAQRIDIQLGTNNCPADIIELGQLAHRTALALEIERGPAYRQAPPAAPRPTVRNTLG
ncbi:MAG: hypothetical protein U0074_02335 [Kouleothrix sp.]